MRAKNSTDLKIKVVTRHIRRFIGDRPRIGECRKFVSCRICHISLVKYAYGRRTRLPGRIPFVPVVASAMMECISGQQGVLLPHCLVCILPDGRVLMSSIRVDIRGECYIDDNSPGRLLGGEFLLCHLHLEPSC